MTDTKAARSRLASHPNVKAQEALPAYGVGDGVLSFRHGLPACERNAIDRALAIVGRCLREPGTTLDYPDAVKQYLRLQLAAEKRERFGVLYLDSQHRGLAFEFHFNGTLTQTSVYPREIVLAALRHHAAAVVLTHNHPSGEVIPSEADERLTNALIHALALVDVKVLDHVIIGGDKAFSMAECGISPFGHVAVQSLPHAVVSPTPRKRGRPRKAEAAAQAA